MSRAGSASSAPPRRASSSRGRPNTPAGSATGRRCASPMSTRNAGTASPCPAASTGSTWPAARCPAGPRCSPPPPRHRLAAGAEVTVLDLTEGSVALDLIAFARTVRPRAAGLGAARGPAPARSRHRTGRPGPGRRRSPWSASATEEQGSTRDLSFDNAILERVIDALGGTATVAGVAAALRTLAAGRRPARGRGRRADQHRAGGPAHHDVRPRGGRPRGRRAGLGPGVPAAQAGRRGHRARPAARQRAPRDRRGPARGLGRGQDARDLPGRHADPRPARRPAGTAVAAHDVRAGRGPAARRHRSTA